MTQSTPTSKRRSHPWLASLSILLIIITLLAAYAFVPQNIGGLVSNPNPAKDYADAQARFQSIHASEGPEINPECQTALLTHGAKTDRAIILVHGYTSCPAQFKLLGDKFYALGYNVLIARLPHHGLQDRLTDDQANLTAEEAIQYADTVVDIGHGLGEHVTMMGISGGGVITGWAAQYRGDLDLAVTIAPAFGYQAVPTPLTAGAANIYIAIPNSFTWWDDTVKEQGGAPYAYPRYSTHALAQLLRVGFAAQAGARSGPPAAHRVIVVTNANDTSVNNALTKTVAEIWRGHGGSVDMYEFDASLQLPHDVIDPLQSAGRIDIVYPQLIKLVTQ